MGVASGRRELLTGARNTPRATTVFPRDDPRTEFRTNLRCAAALLGTCGYDAPQETMSSLGDFEGATTIAEPGFQGAEAPTTGMPKGDVTSEKASEKTSEA